jgi:hypothetical protein
MTRSTLALAIVLAGCAHHKDAEVTAAVEPSPTIGFGFTADTARVQSGPLTAAGGVRGLATLIEAQFATIGTPRPTPAPAADGSLQLVVDLPAPGWALRARIVPKPELLAQVSIEPIATEPTPHPVLVAPWSVQRAFDDVRLAIAALRPPTLPPMTPAHFSRLRAEATAAAQQGRDPLLTPEAYVRVPRPISSEGPEAPYYTPPQDLESPLQSK